MNGITPEVCVLSVGANPYEHPTAEAMGRIHAHGIETHWTNTGLGVAPDSDLDEVDGDIVISAGVLLFVTGLFLQLVATFQ